MGCFVVVLLVTFVGGVAGSFVDAVGAAGLVVAGLAATVLVAVYARLGVPLRERTRGSVAKVIIGGACLDLLFVGGLALLHQPWRPVGGVAARGRCRPAAAGAAPRRAGAGPGG